jgi:hypothetical protein
MNPTSFHLEVRLVELEINLSDGRLLRLPSSPTGSTTTSDEDAGAGEADVETDVETEETDQE